MDINVLPVSENLKEGLKAIHKDDLHNFFQAFIATKLNKMKTPQLERSLTDLNNTVIVVGELEHLMNQIQTS